jgi:translation initiation factor IF-2
MQRKKRLHELARELDVTTDRLMEIALRLGLRFSSNFNAVEPEQEERLRLEVKGPVKQKKRPIVKIVKTAKEKAAEAAMEVALAEGLPAEEAAISEGVAEVPLAEEVAERVLGKKIEELEGPPEAIGLEKVTEEVTEASGMEIHSVEEMAVAPAAAVIEVEKVEEPVSTIAPPTEKAGEVSTTLEKDVVRAQGKAIVEPLRRVFEKPAPPRRTVRPMPPAVAGAGEEEEGLQRKRRKRRRKRKERIAATAVEEVIIPGKKRAKMPTKPTVDHVMLSEGMTLKELADKLGITAKDVIQKLLFEKGVMANINQVLDMELAKEIAEGYSVSTEVMSYEEEIALVDELQVEGKAQTRAPVVTLMGHVDHGKTTLLDYIRKSNVVSGEFGGITQHIGAYKIKHGEHDIVFLDTPGHAAFTRLRARGAKVTDIVLLIIAADDGVMPQTVEAIQHAKAANVPIIVVITKVDLPRANVDKVKKGLSENNILVESWGGEVVSVEVSGKTGKGVEELLEMILLVAELQNLKAYPDIKGVGTVLEARLDRARGPVATVLVQNGTVKIGDFFIAGAATGRVKAMIDEKSDRLTVAEPSTPVEILGFSEVPEAGDQFQVVADENKARQMVAYRQEKSRATHLAGTGTKMSLDDLFTRIEEGEVKELALIIKGDVRGSVEALSDALDQLSTEKVKVKIELAQPGAINESDVLLAAASAAIIIGFNVRAQKSAEKIAEKEGVEIRTYNVIYEATKDVHDAMRGLVEPKFKEMVIGKAEVRQIFKVPKIGVVAGLHVTEGLLKRNAGVRVIREDVVIHEGKVASLKRFKDDVREVKSGFECGLGIENFKDLREGDVIEMFVKEEVAVEL